MRVSKVAIIVSVEIKLKMKTNKPQFSVYLIRHLYIFCYDKSLEKRLPKVFISFFSILFHFFLLLFPCLYNSKKHKVHFFMYFCCSLTCPCSITYWVFLFASFNKIIRTNIIRNNIVLSLVVVRIYLIYAF